MSLKLLENMVAVERLTAASQTEGGILLPSQSKKQPNRGIVRHAGPGKVASVGAIMPMTVEVGDTVYWTSYSGIPVEVDGVELLIMAETEILALERGKDEEALESA